MLEQIGIDREIKKDTIKRLLSDIFKGCKIHYFDQGNTWEVEDEEQLDDHSICFSLIKSESEFPIMIEITGTPDENTKKLVDNRIFSFSSREISSAIENMNFCVFF